MNNVANSYPEDIRDSEVATEEYSVLAKKATVNSNYISQISAMYRSGKEMSDNEYTVMDQPEPTYCPVHPDRTIVYFCCQWYKLVWSHCMFQQHNGHELSQLSEIYKNVTDNVASLATEITTIRKRIIMSKKYLEKVSFIF